MGTFANREWNPALGPRVNSRYYSTGSEPGRARNRLRKGLLYRPGSDLTDENERAGPTAIMRVSFGERAGPRHGIARGGKSGWSCYERCFFRANDFEHWFSDDQTRLQRYWDIVARVERKGANECSGRSAAREKWIGRSVRRCGRTRRSRHACINGPTAGTKRRTLVQKV